MEKNKMKAVKNSIFGIVMLMATQSFANNADLQKEAREEKVMKYTFASSLYQLEQKLIKDYLFDAYQSEIAIEESKNVKIFNQNGKLVFQGKENETKGILLQSSFLFNRDNTKFYLIVE
jgi:hypothetical protein